MQNYEKFIDRYRKTESCMNDELCCLHKSLVSQITTRGSDKVLQLSHPGVLQMRKTLLTLDFRYMTLIIVGT